LAGDTTEIVSSPLFATSVGLLMSALEELPAGVSSVESVDKDFKDINDDNQSSKDIIQQRKSILDRFGEKLKEFLDNA
jgi:cell division protein FtsA